MQNEEYHIEYHNHWQNVPKHYVQLQFNMNEQKQKTKFDSAPWPTCNQPCCIWTHFRRQGNNVVKVHTRPRIQGQNNVSLLVFPFLCQKVICIFLYAGMLVIWIQEHRSTENHPREMINYILSSIVFNASFLHVGLLIWISVAADEPNSFVGQICEAWVRCMESDPLVSVHPRHALRHPDIGPGKRHISSHNITTGGHECNGARPIAFISMHLNSDSERARKQERGGGDLRIELL